MVQCCPTGDKAVVQCSPTVSRRTADVEGSRGTVLSQRVRTPAWKDPVVQCCPIGCTSEPGDVKSVGVEVPVDLHVCVIVLIIMVVSVMYRVSVIVFQSIISR